MTLLLDSLAERARLYPRAGDVWAFDLGTRAGWAVRHLDGTIRHGVWSFAPGPREGYGWRFLRFRRALADLHRGSGLVQGGGVEAVFYERVDFGKNVEALKVQAGFEATLCAWCEANRVPYQGFQVSQIKKFAAGSGNAAKPDVMRAMNLIGHEPGCPDEADALAVLYMGLEWLGNPATRAA